MAILTVTEHPDEVLRTKALPVIDFTPSLQTLAEDMLETLQKYGGIGLSAPQIAQSKRMVVTKMADDIEAEIYINPEIVARSATGIVQESCLSLPGVSGNVVRSTKLKVAAFDTNGSRFEKNLSGMHAVCLQHEIDHLDGVLFIDRMLSIKNILIPASVQRWWASKSVRA